MIERTEPYSHLGLPKKDAESGNYVHPVNLNNIELNETETQQLTKGIESKLDTAFVESKSVYSGDMLESLSIHTSCRLLNSTAGAVNKLIVDFIAAKVSTEIEANQVDKDNAANIGRLFE